ncbi:hypothetical protein [Algibacter sp. L1A34]|uniref:hypothetical protein n=1 Tax=Algibacter sp. L1A34 TaxID=2686365 RepID=UPI00131D2F24|nr:hypothetical protein [Algibacter sp. L1A34]
MKNFISILTLSLFVSINAFAQFSILIPETFTDSGTNTIGTFTYNVTDDNFFEDSAIMKSIEIDVPGATSIEITVSIEVELTNNTSISDCGDTAEVLTYLLNENGEDVSAGNYSSGSCGDPFDNYYYTDTVINQTITVNNGSISVIGLELSEWLGASTEATFTISYTSNY